MKRVFNVHNVEMDAPPGQKNGQQTNKLIGGMETKSLRDHKVITLAEMER